MIYPHNITTDDANNSPFTFIFWDTHKDIEVGLVIHSKGTREFKSYISFHFAMVKLQLLLGLFSGRGSLT